jgi:hypothetical protein
MWGYSERYITDPIYSSFEGSKDIPYIHKPNLVQARARGLAVINTDSLGLRSKTPGTVYGPKQPQEYRIAIFGDSVTFGEGFPRTKDTYAQVLEDILNQNQNSLRVKVFNFGVSAYSVKQMAATLKYRMEDVEPDLVVLAIIPHDLDLSRTPGVVIGGYLVDEKVLPFLSPDSPIRLLLRFVRLTYALRDLYLSICVKPLDMYQRLAAGEIPDSYRFIQQFRDTAKEKSFRYLVALLPSWQEGAWWNHITKEFEQEKIAYLDVSSLRKEFTWEHYRASSFDRHPSPAVHQRIGEVLADYISSKILISDSIPKDR